MYNNHVSINYIHHVTHMLKQASLCPYSVRHDNSNTFSVL